MEVSSIDWTGTAAVSLAVTATTLLVLIIITNFSSSNWKPVHIPSESAVLITGGSRGIGRKTADYLSERGYGLVLVTVRNKSQFDDLEKKHQQISTNNRNGTIRPVMFDVTNDSHVDPAVERVKSVLEETKTQLVAIVNNAGINPEGDAYAEIVAKGQTVENQLASPDIAIRVLQTNVVGPARVTRAFLPFFKSREGGRSEGQKKTSLSRGRVVNIGSYFGSIAGQIGLCHAYYETSKFALEGMSDNMRRSLSSEGIGVCLVKPGNIATDMNSGGEVGPEAVAADVFHAIAAEHPRPRYYPGTVKGYPTKVLCFMFEMLPTSLVDKV